MRSIILSSALASLTATGAIAAAPMTGAPAASTRCPEGPTAHLARPGKGALHRKLTQPPPAEGFRAVYRRDGDGCMVPVKVEFRSGQPGR